MNRSNILVLAAIAASSALWDPSSAAANEREGHGGISYVCRDPQGNITKAELLDFWERENIKITRSDVPVQTQIDGFLTRFSYDEKLLGRLSARLKYMQKIVRPTSRPLPLTSDALPAFEKERGCDFEQVARYELDRETNRWVLKVYSGIFNDPHFSNTDRAGLFAHETISDVHREVDEKVLTTDKSRVLVAMSFADGADGELVRDYMTTQILEEEPRAEIVLDPAELNDPTPYMVEIKTERGDGILQASGYRLRHPDHNPELDFGSGRIPYNSGYVLFRPGFESPDRAAALYLSMPNGVILDSLAFAVSSSGRGTIRVYHSNRIVFQQEFYKPFSRMTRYLMRLKG